MQIHNASTRISLLLCAAFLSSCGVARSAPAKAPHAAKHAVKKTPAKTQKKAATTTAVVKPAAPAASAIPITITPMPDATSKLTSLLFRNTEASAPPGTLLNMGGYLVFLKVGKAYQAGEPAQSFDVNLQTAENYFSAKFSPDGRYVSFGVGWPWDPPYLYKLYFFDRQTQRVLAGPPESTSWQLSYWAPDSDKLAFLSGDELRVYSLKERKSFFIVRDPGVNDLTWTEQNTLLVTRLAARATPNTPAATAKKSGVSKASAAPNKSEAAANEEKDAPPLVEDVLRPLAPSVFEFAATGGDGKMVLEGARYAVPSPDGRWLAYYGLAQEPPPYSEYSPLTPAQKEKLSVAESRTQEKERSRKRGEFIEAINRPRFCLYDRVAKERYLLADQPKFDTTTLIWARDSRRLIFMTKTYNEELRQENVVGRARISVLSVTGDVTTQTAKPLITLESVDGEAAQYAYYRPKFSTFGMSRDNKYLFLQSVSFNPTKDPLVLRGTKTLRAINLQDGSSIELGRVSGADYDWHDESVAPAVSFVTTQAAQEGGKQP